MRTFQMVISDHLWLLRLHFSVFVGAIGMTAHNEALILTAIAFVLRTACAVDSAVDSAIACAADTATGG